MLLDYGSESERRYTFWDFVDDSLAILVVGGIVAGTVIHYLYDSKASSSSEPSRISSPSPLEEIK